LVQCHHDANEQGIDIKSCEQWEEDRQQDDGDFRPLERPLKQKDHELGDPEGGRGGQARLTAQYGTRPKWTSRFVSIKPNGY
jgi:hypothetical protein